MEKFGSRAKAAYVAALFCGVECLMSGPPWRSPASNCPSLEKIHYIYFLMNTIKMVDLYIWIFPPLYSLKNWSFVPSPQKSNLLPVDHPSFYRLIGNFSVGHRYQPNFWGVKMTSKLAKADEWGYSQLWEYFQMVNLSSFPEPNWERPGFLFA